MTPPQIQLSLAHLGPFAGFAALGIALAAALLALRHRPIRDLRPPATLASALVVPFMVLEFVNRRALAAAFAVPLSAILWLLPFSFTWILRATLRDRSEEGTTPWRLSHLPVLAALSMLAWLWIGLGLDQMPCFLGVPNCD